MPPKPRENKGEGVIGCGAKLGILSRMGENPHMTEVVNRLTVLNAIQTARNSREKLRNNFVIGTDDIAMFYLDSTK